MKLSAVFLCVLVSAATCQFANEDSSKAVFSGKERPQHLGIIQNLIEDFLNSIAGQKERRIPKIEIDGSSSFRDIFVQSDIEVLAFKMNEMFHKFNIRNLTVSLNKLDTAGSYLFDELALPGGLIIYGNGKFRIELQELKVFLSLEAKHSSATGLWKVNNVTVDTSAESIQIKFENLMNGEPMGEFLNYMVVEVVNFAIDFVGGIVEQYKPEVMDALSKIINGFMPESTYSETNVKRGTQPTRIQRQEMLLYSAIHTPGRTLGVL